MKMVSDNPTKMMTDAVYCQNDKSKTAIKEDIIKKIEMFSLKTILVIGDVMLDRYYYGSRTRPSPDKADVPVLLIDKKEKNAGGASNVANNITAMGSNSLLYGLIGRDPNGDSLVDICKKSKILFSPFYDTRPTTVKTRLLLNDKQLIRFDEEDAIILKGYVKNNILNKFSKDIGKINTLILSDYNKGIFSKEFCQKLIDIAKKNDVPVLADPKPQNIDYFKNCTLICPNRHEAEQITGIKCEGIESLISTGKELIKRVNSEFVLVTCGEKGMFSYDMNNNYSFIPTFARKVNDIVGAGDTVVATLSLCLSLGIEIHTSAKIANYAAGIVVGKVGTSTIEKNELINYIKEHNNLS